MGILVIDDSPIIRSLVATVLTNAGHDRVEPIENAAAALERFGIGADGGEREAGWVDLILMDILMPEIDGIEACARFKMDPRFADVPIIMVTSETEMTTLDKAFIAGAVDYITKPVRPVELLARVRSALKIKQELDRRQARERTLSSMVRTREGERPGFDAARHIDAASGLPDLIMAAALVDGRLHARIPAEYQVIVAGFDSWPSYTTRHGTEEANLAMERLVACASTLPGRAGDVLARLDDGKLALFRCGPGSGDVAGQLVAAVRRMAIRHNYADRGEILTATAAVGAVTQDAAASAQDVQGALERALHSGADRVVRAVEFGAIA